MNFLISLAVETADLGATAGGAEGLHGALVVRHRPAAL